MKIEDHGLYVEFCEGGRPQLRVSRVHYEGSALWVVWERLGSRKYESLSVHTAKRDAMDAAMAYLTVRKLKGDVDEDR